MGTNLSQVFVSNGDILLDDTTFNSSNLTAGKAGIWADNKYQNWGTASKLFGQLLGNSATFTGTEANLTGEAESYTPEGAISVNTVAGNFFNYETFQLVQGFGSGNPIATPLIQTRDIKNVTVSAYQSFVGTKAAIVDEAFDVAGAAANDKYNFKFIIKTVPTDYLNYYDQEGLNLFVDFPLGAFNTTNHKAINLSVTIPTASDADGTGNLSKIQDAIAAHPILSKMFTAAYGGNDIVITAIHPGVVFDLLIQNLTADTDPIACEITGQVLGVGNPWQVVGEELRTRSRYANFNRMYFPQHMPTFTNTANTYHKITFEYEHNWPNSTGIAPAGRLNQAVLYIDSDAVTNITNALPTNAILATPGATNRFLF